MRSPFLVWRSRVRVPAENVLLFFLALLVPLPAPSPPVKLQCALLSFIFLLLCLPPSTSFNRFSLHSCLLCYTPRFPPIILLFPLFLFSFLLPFLSAPTLRKDLLVFLTHLCIVTLRCLPPIMIMVSFSLFFSSLSFFLPFVSSPT